ncbi:MAG: uracil-DNA glycosylase [Gammaproteobacteria bacterium]
MPTQVLFDPECRKCSRLADFLRQIKEKQPEYHCRPVAPFGDPNARLLIVGLAPGMHGANATGRPFTGDFAGILLYQTLYRFGYSNRPESVSRDDGLVLKNCRITNAVKCLPPDNKPSGREIRQCNDFLREELQQLPADAVVLALGTIAHNAVVRASGLRQSAFPFGHGRQHALGERLWMVDSYHCSRYNTQTRRLTESMFHEVFRRIGKLMGGNGATDRSVP